MGKKKDHNHNERVYYLILSCSSYKPIHIDPQHTFRIMGSIHYQVNYVTLIREFAQFDSFRTIIQAVIDSG